MGIPVLPFMVLAALAILALAAWAFVRAIKGNRRVSMRHAFVLMACCLALWLGLCIFFMVLAALGHSTHPLRDSWPQCVASLFVLFVAPPVLFIWLAGRRSARNKMQRVGGDEEMRQP
jgi:cytochrome bd-type quinol oxidase subunit 2